MNQAYISPKFCPPGHGYVRKGMASLAELTGMSGTDMEILEELKKTVGHGAAVVQKIHTRNQVNQQKYTRDPGRGKHFV